MPGGCRRLTSSWMGGNVTLGHADRHASVMASSRHRLELIPGGLVSTADDRTMLTRPRATTGPRARSELDRLNLIVTLHQTNIN